MSKFEFFNDLNTNSCYIIAEAGLNHNGSINIAKELIDVAVEAGADAVKFQKRTVSILATNDVLDLPDNRFPEFGKTYREIREFIEFGFRDYEVLKNYAQSKGIDFIVTAFDTDAVDFLERLGVTSYKLASHSLTNITLLNYLASFGKPTVLSTGMAEWDEIDNAVEIFNSHDCPLALLHCVSSYPTPLEDCNLEMINVLKDRFDLPVGYSGHELGFLPSISAVAMGAKIIERHFTLDKKMVGFDHKISLEPEELIRMVNEIRDVEKVLGNGEKNVSDTEMVTRKKYHVSAVSARKILSGETLCEDDITYRNPGTGIPPKKMREILGKKAAQNIVEGKLLTSDMFR